jgi:hypothetical protein
MGRGRVDPAPPVPINSDPKGRRKEERTAANEERNRKREKPTERERGTTGTEKPKNRGYRQGNRERQSGRRKKKDKKEKPTGKKRRLVSLHSGEEASLLSLGLTVIATAAPPRTATVIASSTARDHRLK